MSQSYPKIPEAELENENDVPLTKSQEGIIDIQVGTKPKASKKTKRRGFKIKKIKT